MNNNEQDPIKVLLVDDNEHNIISLTKVLQDLPIEIYSANSGSEAIKQVLRHEFALIFLDVQMPEMNGYEVAVLLSNNQKTASIPIIFVTANYNDIEHIKTGYKSGAVDYLTKPLNPEIVIAKTKIFIKMHQQQTQLKSVIDQLNKLANTDTLTSIPNRHQFNNYIQKIHAISQRHNHEFALMLIDIDNFKFVNDSYGHDYGDALLTHIAEKLTQTLRACDYVARLGGDEFAIIINETENAHSISHIAEKLIHALKQPVLILDTPLKIGISIGVAVFPFAAKNTDSLIKCADVALYRAKSKGKGTFEFYTATLNQDYQRRTQVELRLRQAITNNNIKMVFQPRFNMKTNKISGFEALARWFDNELGDIGPSEFIQIAEDTGLIHELGSNIITMALAQFEKWQLQFPNDDFKLAINVSPYQILHNDFINFLQSTVNSSEANLNRIEFEVTESIFKGETGSLEKTLSDLCKLGIDFAIDDFGSGYSSLSRLKVLPIQILKIDQSFVRDIFHDTNDSTITKAIISMGNAMNLKIIAEGIETQEQAQFLLEQGCVEGQGYFFSKPLDIESATALLRNQEKRRTDSTAQ